MAIINVMDYGAAGDGAANDTAAFLAARDAARPGGVVHVPPGDYRIGGQDIHLMDLDDGITFRGEWGKSVLRLADITPAFSMFRFSAIPNPSNGEVDPAVFATGVTFERLVFDGDLRPIPGPGEFGFFALYVQQAAELTIRQCLFRDWSQDAISFSNGNRPMTDLVIEDCRFDRIARNAVHFGQVDGGVLRRYWISDCPSQHWGPSAGNGIDVEVEGYDYYGPDPHRPAVRNLVIEDGIVEMEAAGVASVGINLQPAYGPLKDVILRRNVICNYQLSLQTTAAPGDAKYEGEYAVQRIAVEDNWLTNRPVYYVQGYPIKLYGCEGVTLSGNVVNSLHGAFSTGAAFQLGQLHDAFDITISGNTVWMVPQNVTAMVLCHYFAKDVSIVGNGYRADELIAYNEPFYPETITESGNTTLDVSAWDQIPPACAFAPGLDGSTIAAEADVTVTATDAGSGVARVFFFVDGIPAGHSDEAPHAFPFDPAVFGVGEHTLSALAVDNQALLGDEVLATITVADVATTAILRETGDILLRESGAALLRESDAEPGPGTGGNILLIPRPGGNVLMLTLPEAS